ncbi:MAG: hypothetical protein EXQ55_03570 [Acidobacteria bacterium]|nr:hypothetical protein [Acidobacteriota bacterium]
MCSNLLRSLVLTCGCALIGSPGFAQQPSEAAALRAEVTRLREALDALETRLAALEGTPQEAPAPTAAPQQPVATPAPSAAVRAGGGVGDTSKVFNPDMSVFANFVGVAGRNSVSEQPSLQLTEVEAAFQAVVDPYARADFFLSAGPDGLEVEEGFITFTSLPANLLLKVGKMRAQFGKVNTLHTHVMPTADRPLVTENLVGGEEGLSDSGFSLSKLVANPFMFIEVTGEVFSGHSPVFQSAKRSALNYVGRLRGYRDLTEGTNIDLGTSVAFGPTEVGPDLNKRLIAIDATFRYRPLRRAIYRRFQVRTEVVWNRQDFPAAAKENAFGYYGLGEYQFARRWYFGGRYDRSQRALDASLRDAGGSLFLTYWPSEFSQVRGQYRRTNYAEGVKANEFLTQFSFAIGAHGAHVF